jgi:multiple sugar transport system substrate-binding protein
LGLADGLRIQVALAHATSNAQDWIYRFDRASKETAMKGPSTTLLDKRLSRRALVGAGAATLAAPAILRSPRSVAAKAELDFTIWDYAEDIVQDNINTFQGVYPDVTVKMSSIAWPEFHTTMVNRFTSKTPTDLTYDGGNWLEEFAAAEWVVPIQDHFDWVTGYKDKIFPFAWQDMTYDGKVYGLPYYSDTITFMYNKRVLEDAGIAAPPATWEEVTEQSLQLKEGGMESPFVYEFTNILPNVIEAFASMVFGRGGELIDEEKNPLWTDPESPAAQQFNWLVDAKNTDGILTIMDHETTITKAMNTGKHAFTVMFNYNLGALNNAATSPLAGEFALVLMPGESHECYGFAKMYNMTQMAVDRGQEVIDASGNFIQYFAGEVDGTYPVAKRWAVEQALGFAQIPLTEDPDVIEAFSKWVDVDLWRDQLAKARARRQAVWYGIFAESFNPLLGQALNGEISSEEALQQAADEWNTLKERVAG